MILLILFLFLHVYHTFMESLKLCLWPLLFGAAFMFLYGLTQGIMAHGKVKK